MTTSIGLDVRMATTMKLKEMGKNVVARWYDTKTRRLILGERRPAIMEWLAMTPR